MSRVMTLKEASQYLSIHPEVLRKKAAKGEIPGQKLGMGKKSPWRFLESDLESWFSSEEKEKRAALADDQKIEDLIKTVTSIDDLEKLSDAIASLGFMGAESAVDAILPHLASPFEDIEYLACRALIQILGPESELYVYSKIQKQNVSKAGILVAGYFASNNQDEEGRQYLINVFETQEDLLLKRAAAYKLLRMETELVLPFVREELNAPHAAVRYNALLSLKQVFYQGIEDDLRVAIQDRLPNIQKKAIEIVGLHHLESMVPDLIEVLKSDMRDTTKQEASIALARIYGWQEI